MDGTDIAPEGHIWVCLACGKTSKTKYGFTSDDKSCCDLGWDASCVLNSQMLPVDRLVFEGKRVVKVSVEADPGPQKSPSSPSKVTAEWKQSQRELGNE